ncbi:thioredoxin-like protein 4B isoform X1 [Eubalaena glacialis]|uniref:thioredoxin-like protein 4B isoform X1 n=1 Tax=Eubalaena glacialis TaxID=27606 RepID=UPI002A59EA80|nr:thioredoxin-like protein 4B isoform X1 [Eubalaena glacialis]XP_061028964.1 thioredoxin-like protein 4B isoform X1 [Eubalaena glacialis]XP_061028965.1 thioredoxin-like protein 4B isoform X1 [Eubalaena glacialis]XP_061028966.1 thioredoxin-like protein 4B isoform X1 [Eubalaena glacialis]XP_061028967.1 thioredoxin-like protein 4B isoform X1 [Eubalaena glacialis]
MSFLLPKLSSKKEVDQAIKSTAEKVLVLRFGRDEDPVCLQLDDILSKTSSDLSKMAAIYLVDVDQTPVYTHYFDISYIPSTVFFFNGQHMKVDYGCFLPKPSLTNVASKEGCWAPLWPSLIKERATPGRRQQNPFTTTSVFWPPLPAFMVIVLHGTAPAVLGPQGNQHWDEK